MKLLTKKQFQNLLIWNINVYYAKETNQDTIIKLIKDVAAENCEILDENDRTLSAKEVNNFIKLNVSQQRNEEFDFSPVDEKELYNYKF